MNFLNVSLATVVLRTLRLFQYAIASPPHRIMRSKAITQNVAVTKCDQVYAAERLESRDSFSARQFSVFIGGRGEGLYTILKSSQVKGTVPICLEKYYMV